MVLYHSQDLHFLFQQLHLLASFNLPLYEHFLQHSFKSLIVSNFLPSWVLPSLIANRLTSSSPVLHSHPSSSLLLILPSTPKYPVRVMTSSSAPINHHHPLPPSTPLESSPLIFFLHYSLSRGGGGQSGAMHPFHQISTSMDEDGVGARPQMRKIHTAVSRSRGR